MTATARSAQHLSDVVVLSHVNHNEDAAAHRHVDAILQAMPSAIITLDSQGYINHANRAAHELLGVELEQRLWRELIREVFAPRADDGHEVSLKNGRRVRLDISSLAPQPGQLIVLTDLTETRALQARMSQLQRLSSMGRMVAALAHQIRTPLSAAMLYAENLQNPRLQTHQRQPFIQKLSARLQTLEHQVNDMLLFAKSGEQQVVKPFNISELLSALEQQTEAFLQQQGARLEMTQPATDVYLQGNINALVGALQNLVMNGVQASAPNAVIELTAEVINERLKIEITDHGCGMDEVQQRRIFTPFVTTKTHGTGLGLAVVQTVAKAHQGHIEVISAVDVGTTFTLHFPILQNFPESNSHVAPEREHAQEKPYV